MSAFGHACHECAHLVHTDPAVSGVQLDAPISFLKVLPVPHIVGPVLHSCRNTVLQDVFSALLSLLSNPQRIIVISSPSVRSDRIAAESLAVRMTLDWALVRPEVYKLYIVQGKGLEEVRGLIQSQNNFDASYRRLLPWFNTFC